MNLWVYFVATWGYQVLYFNNRFVLAMPNGTLDFRKCLVIYVLLNISGGA